jgi:hypothetical protein
MAKGKKGKGGKGHDPWAGVPTYDNIKNKPRPQGSASWASVHSPTERPAPPPRPSGATLEDRVVARSLASHQPRSELYKAPQRSNPTPGARKSKSR